MTTRLLTTKLYIPPPRPGSVPRPRLVQGLDEGLRQGRRLTLVSAPPGFGKTTLVSEWVGRGQRPVGWVSLDEGDNDPVQFLNYLLAALQQVDDRIGQTARGLLQSPQPPPPQGLVTLLINDIGAVGAALTLVLDDYQLITSPSVHQVVQFLLEHQPPALHLVMISREDPPLPLPRLRARGQVTEMRERDLRFSAEEAAAFLKQTMGLDLSPEAVTALETRTEGWIAGLQLAALALQEGQDAARAEAFAAAFTGDDRYVMDYLVAEVLERQPEATRAFLRPTAILDRLTAPLCNALTGREDGQAMLDQLSGANLFLIPLDHRREWYRYHRLFAEVLRATLDPGEQMRLHRGAAHWHEAHGLMSQAIQHALAYASASGDPSTGSPVRASQAQPAPWPGGQDGLTASPGAGQALADAERLIRLAAEDTLGSGGVLTVRAWLDALPEARVRSDGELATYQGWALALTGEMARAEEYAKAAETSLRQVQAAPMSLGKLLLLRGFIALLVHRDYEQALELTTSALAMLQEDRSHWRVIGLWAQAEALERTRPIGEAIDAWREARRIGRALGDQIFVVVVEASLASALQYHGQRQEAIAVCQEALARYTDGLGRTLPIAGLICSRLGMLHYEAHQLELARRCHEQALALSQQLGLEGSLISSHGLAAPTLYAQGETGAALEALHQATQFAAQTGLSDADWSLAWEVNIRLKQGDLPFALQWAERAGLSPDVEPDYLRMEAHLAYARLLLAQGRLSAAQTWLARLERFTQERGFYRWLITVQIQQALVAERSGDQPAARSYLARAVQMAAPEGYVRAFLDEDARAIAMLPAVRHVAPLFVAQVLDYAGVPGPRRDISTQILLEPLSQREIEVLRLIAAGHSNQEIAQALIISVGTVKRHINHIYAKLDVTSRTQASVKARELRLLE